MEGSVDPHPSSRMLSEVQGEGKEWCKYLIKSNEHSHVFKPPSHSLGIISDLEDERVVLDVIKSVHFLRRKKRSSINCTSSNSIPSIIGIVSSVNRTDLFKARCSSFLSSELTLSILRKLNLNLDSIIAVSMEISSLSCHQAWNENEGVKWKKLVDE